MGTGSRGIGFKLVFIGRFHLRSTLQYVGMGLIALVAIGPLVEHLSTATLVLLVAGGVAYIAGTVVYHSRRLRHAHTVWHLFVIAGSACHWIAVSTII